MEYLQKEEQQPARLRFLIFRCLKKKHQNLPSPPLFSRIGPHKTEPFHPPLSGPQKLLTARIRQYIFVEEGFRDPELTLVRLAAVLQVNRTFLSQTINRTAGKNFNRWLNDIRIREALPLLAEKNRTYSLTAIAYQVGFHERTTFFRSFKRLYGISPSGFCRGACL